MSDSTPEPFSLKPPFRGDGDNWAEKLIRSGVDRTEEQSAVDAAGDAETLREAAEHLDLAASIAVRHGLPVAAESYRRAAEQCRHGNGAEARTTLGWSEIR